MILAAIRFFDSNKIEKNKQIGRLRRTQLITTFGSGAIVDMPNYSVIMAATDYWNSKSPILHEPNLEKLLNARYFKQPYIDQYTQSEFSTDIPAWRFPIMHFCPECKRLMPYWKFDRNSGIKCPKCDKHIVPSRFIAACINGHIEDFPYRWWVHYGNLKDCKSTNNDDSLRIEFSDTTGGLESIVITCTKCGKSRSMAGCLGAEALKGYICRGKRPWISSKEEDNDPEKCTAQMRGLQRGASNVYFSQTVSALTIPPWSNKLNQEIGKKWDLISERLARNYSKEQFKNSIIDIFYDLLQTEEYTVDDILKEIDVLTSNGEKSNYTKQNLYEDEYQVFEMGNYQQDDDYQFRIEKSEIPECLKDYIEDVVLVKRLREVLVLQGFRRITPESPSEDDKIFSGYHVEGDCISLSKEDLDWYPGIEMLGEGIFIRLKEDRVKEWAAKNEQYYKEMEDRLKRSNVDFQNFSARYVLLHSLSHLLIRQLSIECGYSGASIKERIYSTYPDAGIEMAGILLYTSSSDADGSLGGLVRNGLPKAFERIFKNMLEEASWCSSDPICIESHAQGYDSLNYAACHACTLLPETSCEMRNCLLDRGAVVGTLLDRERGYFGELIK